MSMDGLFLNKIKEEIKNELVGGRVSKIYQLSNYDFLFVLRSKSKKQELVISASPEYSRIHLTKLAYDKPSTPPTFCMFLRKHLEGGKIKDIKQHNNDRIIIIEFETRNELGDFIELKLIAELMGKHSNIIVTNNDLRIMEAIKHVSPFDEQARTVHPGATYTFPESTKKDPFDLNEVDKFFKNNDNFNAFEIRNNFEGLSPLFTNDLIYQFENSNTDILEIYKTLLQNTLSPTLIKSTKNTYYFYDPISIEGDRVKYESLNDLVDAFYFKKDEQKKVKQKSKDLELFIKNSIKKLKSKIRKQKTELEDASNKDIYRVKGELIKANLHLIKKGDTSITCLNYYTNEDIKIILDEKLNPIKNSEKYFKKFKKLKNSVVYLENEILLSENALEYFNLLHSQLETSSLNDVDEIRLELELKGYIKKRNKKGMKKGKPNFLTYYDEDGCEILVGKNNIQNDYISNKLAEKTDMWFHIKDFPGSHVVVRSSEDLSETTIRTAAILAAYYSKMRTSGSVAVDYTKIRYLRKVPKKDNSFVTYKTNKTIYIDPTEEFVQNLRMKK